MNSVNIAGYVGLDDGIQDAGKLHASTTLVPALGRGLRSITILIAGLIFGQGTYKRCSTFALLKYAYVFFCAC